MFNRKPKMIFSSAKKRASRDRAPGDPEGSRPEAACRFEALEGRQMYSASPLDIAGAEPGTLHRHHPAPRYMAPNPSTASPASDPIDLGTVTRTMTLGGSAGNGQSDTYYRFVAGSTKGWMVTLSGAANVELLDGDGHYLCSSQRAMSRALIAGQAYELHVSGQVANTAFTLTILQDNVGDTPSTARDLGLATPSRRMKGWLGDANRQDCYRFVAGGAGDWTFRASNLPSGSLFRLTEVNGKTWVSAHRTRLPGQSVGARLRLTAGATYYASVIAAQGGEPRSYTLTIAAPAGAAVAPAPVPNPVPAPDTDAPTPTPPPAPAPGPAVDYAGNLLATARDIGTLTTNQSFNDWVGGADPWDFYKFVAGKTGTLRASLQGISTNVTLYVKDPVIGIPLAQDPGSGGQSRYVEYQVTAGTTYVVHVAHWIPALASFGTTYVLDVGIS